MEILKKVTALQAELDELRPFDKDREAAIMQKLRLDWNFHSNHLEGNSLTFGETKALILFGITAAGKPLKDHFEMTGHDEAVKWVEDVVKEGRPLKEMFIRELHQLILKEPSIKRTKTPDGLPGTRIINIGAYKTVPNHVETVTGEMFYFATPEETPAMMHDLIEWYRQKESDPETHPLLMAAEFHFKFIRIHPFDDGNGRTARILMNFILMKYGYPPVIIKTEDKANYIAALQQSDAGIISPFIEYIGHNLAYSLDIMIRGAKGENIDEPDDVDKEIALIEQKVKSRAGQFMMEKSQKVLIDTFEKSIKRLLIKYQDECSKFNRLYNQSKISFAIIKNSDFSQNTPPFFVKRISEIVNQINSEIHEIYVFCNFSSFKGTVIFDFKYDAHLTINFNSYDYLIKLFYDKKIWSKNYQYSDILTDDEVAEIVRLETKAHTDFIKQQIEQAQQKNKTP